MDLYILWADEYDDAYGIDINIIGIFSSYEKAENAIKELIEKDKYARKYSFEIEKTSLDKLNEVHLASYFE